MRETLTVILATLLIGLVAASCVAGRRLDACYCAAAEACVD